MDRNKHEKDKPPIVYIDDIVDHELEKLANGVYESQLAQVTLLSKWISLLIAEFAIKSVCIIPELISNGSLETNPKLYHKYWTHDLPLSKHYKSRVATSRITPDRIIISTSNWRSIETQPLLAPESESESESESEIGIESDTSDSDKKSDATPESQLYELLLIQRGIILSCNNYILPIKHNNGQLHIRLKFECVGRNDDFLWVLTQTLGSMSGNDNAQSWGMIDRARDGSFGYHLVLKQATSSLNLWSYENKYSNKKTNLKKNRYRLNDKIQVHTMDITEQLFMSQDSDGYNKQVENEEDIDMQLHVIAIIDNEIASTIKHVFPICYNKQKKFFGYIGNRIAVTNREVAGCILSIRSLAVRCDLK